MALDERIPILRITVPSRLACPMRKSIWLKRILDRHGLAALPARGQRCPGRQVGFIRETIGIITCRDRSRRSLGYSFRLRSMLLSCDASVVATNAHDFQANTAKGRKEELEPAKLLGAVNFLSPWNLLLGRDRVIRKNVSFRPKSWARNFEESPRFIESRAPKRQFSQ